MFMGRKASLSMSKMIFLASALATTILPPPMEVAVSCHFLSVGSRDAALALAAFAAAFLETLPLPEEAAAAAEAPRGGTGEGVTPLVAVVLADEDLSFPLLLPPFLDLAVVTNPLPGGGVTAPPPAAAAGGAGGSGLVGRSGRIMSAVHPTVHLSAMRARWD